MGFLKNLMGGSDLEKRLEEVYTHAGEEGMGLSPREARQMARDLLKKAREASKQSGRDDSAGPLGDLLLAKEAEDAKTLPTLSQLRSEGVSDDDIRWWWNMPELERQMMIAHDDTSRMALFIATIKETGQAEEGARRVRKWFPMYGDPSDKSNVSGEDRLLPYELKNRVNMHTQTRVMPRGALAKTEIGRFSSYNAFLREELRHGRL